MIENNHKYLNKGSLYTSTQTQGKRELLRLIHSLSGDIFRSASFQTISGDTTSEDYIECTKSDTHSGGDTELWDVRLYTKTTDVNERGETEISVDTDIILEDLCFIDALDACAQFEHMQRLLQMNEIETAQDSHYITYGEEQGQLFDKRKGKPRSPVAVGNGRILIKGEFKLPANQEEIKKRSLGNIAVPIDDLPLFSQDANTTIEKPTNLPIVIEQKTTALSKPQQKQITRKSKKPEQLMKLFNRRSFLSNYAYVTADQLALAATSTISTIATIVSIAVSPAALIFAIPLGALSVAGVIDIDRLNKNSRWGIARQIKKLDKYADKQQGDLKKEFQKMATKTAISFRILALRHTLRAIENLSEHTKPRLRRKWDRRKARDKKALETEITKRDLDEREANITRVWANKYINDDNTNNDIYAQVQKQWKQLQEVIAEDVKNKVGFATAVEQIEASADTVEMFGNAVDTTHKQLPAP